MTNTNYSPPYKMDGNCLYLIGEDKRGQTRKKLCNFAPYIVQQITKNDGVDSTTWVTIAGIHESGRVLPPTTIRGADLGSTDWVIERWRRRLHSFCRKKRQRTHPCRQPNHSKGCRENHHLHRYRMERDRWAMAFPRAGK